MGWPVFPRRYGVRAIDIAPRGVLRVRLRRSQDDRGPDPAMDGIYGARPIFTGRALLVSDAPLAHCDEEYNLRDKAF